MTQEIEPRGGYHLAWSREEVERRKSFGSLVQKWRWKRDMTQSKFAEEIGLSQPYVCVMEEGKRLPDSPHVVERIIRILGVAGRDKLELLKYAGFPPVIVSLEPAELSELKREQPDLQTSTRDQRSRDNNFTFFAEFDKYLNDTRIQGNPLIAIHLGESSSDYVRSELFLSDHDVYRDQLRTILVKILFQLGRAHTEITPHHELASALRPVLRELEWLAKIYRDQGISWRWNMLAGIVQYHAAIINPGRRDTAYSASIRSLDTALEMVDGVDEKLDVMRAIALDWAYLGSIKMERGQRTHSEASDEQQKFDYYVQKMDHVIGDGRASTEVVCLTYEGIGRGQALLNNDRCFCTLEDNEARCAELKSTVPLRLIQNKRSEIEAFLRFAPKDPRLERLVTEVRSLAGLRYERYAELVERICYERL